MTAKLIALSAITALLLIPAPVQAQDGAVLTAPGVQKLTIGGEMRWRAESRDGNTFTAKKDGTVTAVDYTANTARFRLFMDAQVNDRVNAFIELQKLKSSRDLGDSFEGNTVYQAYGKVADVFDLADVKFGRFKMKYGNGRMIGDNWWAPTARSFEGLHASVKQEGHKFDLFSVRPAAGFHPSYKDGTEEHTLSGLYFENSAEMFNYDAYILKMDFDDAKQDFMTYGVLLDGNNMGLSWNLEYALQNGTGIGEDEWDGDMLVLDATKDMGDGLKLGFGYEVYAPDFQRVHPLGHCYSGWQDIVRWTNYNDFILKASMPVMDGWKGFAEIHNFTEESISETSEYPGASINGFDQDSDDIGTEIDLYFKGKLGKRTGLFVGVSQFNPGDATLNQDKQTWMFAQINMKF